VGEPGPYYGSSMLVREGPNQVSLPDRLRLKLELVDIQTTRILVITTEN
jgi:hypothetical protein